MRTLFMCSMVPKAVCLKFCAKVQIIFDMYKRRVYFVPLKIPFSLSSLLIRLPESRRCVPKSRLQWKLRMSIWRKSRISACCVFGARAEGFCSFGASGSYVGIPSSVIVEFPCQSGLWHPTLRKRETYKFPKQRDRTKRPCEAHRPAVRMAHSLLKGGKAQ